MPLPPLLKKRVRKFWLGSIGVVLFLFLLVSQSVRSILLSYQIQKLESQIRSEYEKKIELQQQRNRLIDLRRVEEIAKEELGFLPAQSKNIVVIVNP